MLILTTPNIEGKKITKYLGLVSGEAILGANIFKDFFAGMAERTVPDVVSEADGLGKAFVKAECAGDGSSDLCDLYTVGKPVAVAVINAGSEHLRLALKAPEGLAVDDAVAVAVEVCTVRVGGSWKTPACTSGDGNSIR